MIVATIILLSAICGFVQNSEIHPIAPPGVAPVVTAASSQYFERTFNRLVAAPAIQPIIPVAPAPPVIVDAAKAITPVIPSNPPPPVPANPNIAIAVATAHAAAPVATILLPPYPFGIPPTLGFIPSAPPFNVPSENPNRESTTQKTTTTVQATTTEKDLGVDPLPSNNDNSFAQPLPSNENVNFRQYLAPRLPVQPLPQQARPYQPPVQPLPQQGRPYQQPLQPLPQQARPYEPSVQPLPQQGRPYQQPLQPLPQHERPYQQPRPVLQPDQPPRLPQAPQKLKTSVEVVPVPLTYIAPPPLFTHAHIHGHHHHDHSHAHIKVPKHTHFHTYIPKKTKIIIKPIRIHTLRVPARLIVHKAMARSSVSSFSQNALKANDPREREPTTFRPINRPMTKPPRL